MPQKIGLLAFVEEMKKSTLQMFITNTRNVDNVDNLVHK